MKCQVCKCDEAIWAWQPFGPDESSKSFAVLGSHYRGFPAIKICDDCHKLIEAERPVEFTYRGQRYLAGDSGIVSVPDYVEDALLYYEEVCV